jgi:1-hydroxy-2-naphthoate dioxygenase
MSAQIQESPELSPLKKLEAELEAVHMRGQWLSNEARFFDGPMPTAVPHVWRWSDISRKLLDACVALPDSRTARRNFTFFNPGLNWAGSTPTLMAGMQIVVPGEVVWAHRHSLGALRFVVEGNPKLFTVVDGEPLTMERHDLILTPAYSWHDHHNEGATHGIWLDVLDATLVQSLNQKFIEPYGSQEQVRRARKDEFVSRRAGLLRPSWEQRPVENFPYRYAWSEVVAALDEFAGLDGSPFDGVSLEYVNPATGGAALPTMACVVQMLRPGFVTKPRRRTTSSVYYVIEGSGRTVFADREIEWTERDTFAVPNWSWHHHVNRSARDRVVLFCVTDEPAISKLGLYREEPENTLRRVPLPPLPPRLAG